MKKNIRRHVVITLMLALTLCYIPMTVNAVTPKPPTFTMPTIPIIKVDIEIPQSVFDNWFAEHPIKLPTTKPNDNIGLGTPQVLEARYYHGQYSRLQIQWNKIEGADSYEVEIVQADGTKMVYKTTSNSLYRSKVECPRVYIEETNTWASATVRVRALNETGEGQWSEIANIGCDKLHGLK